MRQSNWLGEISCRYAAAASPAPPVFAAVSLTIAAPFSAIMIGGVLVLVPASPRRRRRGGGVTVTPKYSSRLLEKINSANRKTYEDAAVYRSRGNASIV